MKYKVTTDGIGLNGYDSVKVEADSFFIDGGALIFTNNTGARHVAGFACSTWCRVESDSDNG